MSYFRVHIVVTLPTSVSLSILAHELINAVKRNTQSLIDASKEVGLEVNTKKTKYMLLSRHQNAG
jgi:hypothetical protein